LFSTTSFTRCLISLASKFKRIVNILSLSSPLFSATDDLSHCKNECKRVLSLVKHSTARHASTRNVISRYFTSIVFTLRSCSLRKLISIFYTFRFSIIPSLLLLSSFSRLTTLESPLMFFHPSSIPNYHPLPFLCPHSPSRLVAVEARTRFLASPKEKFYND